MQSQMQTRMLVTPPTQIGRENVRDHIKKHWKGMRAAGFGTEDDLRELEKVTLDPRDSTKSVR